MGWQPEDLTSQIDGVETYFTTTFQRVLSRVVVFHNGDRITTFTEPDSSRIQTLFTPAPGDTLFVVYWTDQTQDGRVRGYPEDPSGGAVETPTTLDDLLESFDQRLDTLEAAAPGVPVLDNFTPPTGGQTVFTLGQAPVVTRPVLFLLNGNPYTREGGFFTLSGADDKTLTWSGVTVETDDRVEVVYWTL